MLDTLSNRIDYLEKICQKVETASKKHTQHVPSPQRNIKPLKQQAKENTELVPENQAAIVDDKEQRKENKESDADMKKQTAADMSAEKKFALNVGSNRSPSTDSETSPLDSLKSILDVRKKLKIATLDLMNRVKQAEEGVIKNL